jgi:hypothetical protein
LFISSSPENLIGCEPNGGLKIQGPKLPATSVSFMILLYITRRKFIRESQGKAGSGTLHIVVMMLNVKKNHACNTQL